MSSRLVLIRVLLLLIAITVGISVGYLVRRADQQIATGQAAADTLRDRSRALLSTLADVRTGQEAYVAAGQGEEFWIERVSSLLPTLVRQMSDLQGALRSPAAVAALKPAVNAVENLQTLDARARDYVRGGETWSASDLIFSDGLEAAATAAAGIDTALRQDLQARASIMAGARSQEIIVLSAGAGLIFLILLVLAFTGRSAEPSQAAVSPLSIAPAPQHGSQANPAGPANMDQPDLTGAAQLCTDLGRALDTHELPRLLERAARVIDATGIVVWIADANGRELRPVMSYGYSDQVLARMGAIGRDATNVTAAAYRGSELRAVAGDGSNTGAIAAPLMTAQGCVGVLSVEVRNRRERSSASRALTAIFAAQLATLVTVPTEPVQTQTAAQA